MSQDSHHYVIHLPRTTFAPSIGDLQYILKRAKDNTGSLIESTWIPPGSSKMYALSAWFRTGAKTPSWRLLESEGTDSYEIWQRDSYDLDALVQEIGDLSGGSELNISAPTADLLSQYATGSQAKVSNDAVEAAAPKAPEPKEDDFVEPQSELAFLGAASQTAAHLQEQLRHPRTGFYTHSAFMQFLEHEMGRFHSFQTPCTVVIFSIGTDDHETIPLTAAAVSAARLGLAVDTLDIIGHFNHTFYAMLLPSLSRQDAALVVLKAFDFLTASPLAEGISKANLKVSFGIASVPEHAVDQQELLDAAREARSSAAKRDT